MVSRVGTTERTCTRAAGFHGLGHQSAHAYGAAGSQGYGPKTERAYGAAGSGLQDLKGSAHQIEHACEVSGWGCRISGVENTRSNMPTGYKDGTAGSHR